MLNGYYSDSYMLSLITDSVFENVTVTNQQIRVDIPDIDRFLSEMVDYAECRKVPYFRKQIGEVSQGRLTILTTINTVLETAGFYNVTMSPIFYQDKYYNYHIYYIKGDNHFLFYKIE